MMTTQTTPIAFSGDIPAHYDAHLGPMFFEPFSLDMADRVSQLAPSHLLEVACGTGRITKLLPAVMPKGSSITATDLNPAMTGFAKSSIQDPSIRWMEADAVSLPFPDASFDCIVAGFGVMFYSDRVTAYKEAYRILRPGGAFLFSCWDDIQHNPMARFAHDTLTHFFPENTPAFYSVPFAYHDEHLITQELKAAGFQQMTIELKSLTGYSPSAANAATGLIKGTPTITAIEERNKDILPELMDFLEQKIAARFGSISLHVPLQARVVTVVKTT